MTRDRFQILFKFLYFFGNSIITNKDSLFKVRPLQDELLEKFQQLYIYTPRSAVVKNESLFPFRGPLIFK